MTSENAQRKVKSPRRARADSKESAVAAMIHADKVIDPPSDMTMRDNDRKIFDEIIVEFAKIDWSKHNIRIAAILARTIGDMCEDQDDLRIEGSVITNDKGTPIMNPRRTACQGYAGQITQLRRTLALHATAGSSKADVGRRRGINAENEADAPDNDEDLLATPGHG